ASGAFDVKFWDNKKNAVSSSQSAWTGETALNLVNSDGTAFDPTTASQLQAFLKSGSAKNAANTLSVQLATMELNVSAGDVKSTDMVYAGNLLEYVGTSFSTTGLDSGGFISVGALMTL